jgi:hypothetical protein
MTFVILNLINSKIIELPNEIILLFDDFYKCGYQRIVQVPCRLNGRLTTFNEILINNINEENVSNLGSTLCSNYFYSLMNNEISDILLFCS